MLKIEASALEACRRHAVEGYPLEICGFLVGSVDGDMRTCIEAWPVRNAWEDSPDERAALLAALERAGGSSASDWEQYNRERRYLVSGDETLAAMKRARAAGLDLIGVYHTHPNHPAVPSDFDRDAAMPEWSYVILSVQAGAVAETRSWVLPFWEERFREEQLKTFEPARVQVQVPPSLAAFANGLETLHLPGSTVREVLSSLAQEHPALGGQLLREDGSLRSYVNAFVDGVDIRTPAGVDTPLSPAQTLVLVPSIAGG
jgi:proteasome lid subunit RPN8/RPN11/molybdopterin converting factor small subunit